MGNRSKHTPGPWEVEAVDGYNLLVGETLFPILYEVSDGGSIVALISKYEGCDEDNARLIAAAPDLLAALKAVWAMFDDRRVVRNISNDHKPDWALKMLTFARELQIISAAIAKAEGVVRHG